MTRDAFLRWLFEIEAAPLPRRFRWRDAGVEIALLIDGYRLMEEGGKDLPYLADFARERTHEYEIIGHWTGSPIELWLVMFFWQRHEHWQSGSETTEEEEMKHEKRLDDLCEAFRIGISSLSSIDRIALIPCLNQKLWHGMSALRRR